MMRTDQVQEKNLDTNNSAFRIPHSELDQTEKRESSTEPDEFDPLLIQRWLDLNA
ncbi:MAG TPA: hypothetical protein VGZ47_02845 [Gemmataceae bacterium]|jgi:hypothetical protein|nr:hypothetical protein [Gemmataceae bacterium]